MPIENEQDVGELLADLCPDAKLRRIYLSIMSDGIIEANRYDAGKWAVTVDDRSVKNYGIRLQVAHYIICTIDMARKGIWLALDDVILNKNIKQKIYSVSHSQMYNFGWTLDADNGMGKLAYSFYKDSGEGGYCRFSANGYYQIGENYEKGLKHIRKLFLNFIYKAIFLWTAYARCHPTSPLS